MLAVFKGNYKTILMLFLLSLSLRLISVLFIKQYPLTQDDLHYNAVAENILHGNGFSYNPAEPTAARGPVYPFFLASVYSIFGDNPGAARVLQAVLGAITCLLIYFIAKMVFNPKIGFYALMLTAIYPSLIGYSGLLYSETLAAFLLCLVVLLYFLSIQKNSAVCFVVTGIICGLLILCYPKFMLLPVVFGFSMYLFNKLRKEFLKCFFGLIIGASFVVAPWTARNFIVFGQPIPVSTGVGTTLWYSTLPQDYTEWYFDKEPLLSEFNKFSAGEPSDDKRGEFIFSPKNNGAFMQKAKKNIMNNPAMFIKLSFKRFFRQWFSSNSNSFFALRGAMYDFYLQRDYGIFLLKLILLMLQAYIVIFGFLGMVVDFTASRKNFFSPVLISIAYSSFINSIFMTSPRYQIPVLGLLIIYTVIGSQWLFLKLAKREAL